MQGTYDRLAVGERLRERRTALHLSRAEVAEKIDRAEKYYADIERGSCGMSLETIIALSDALSVSIDSIIYGKSFDEHMRDNLCSDENMEWLTMISSLTEKKRRNAKDLLEKFIIFSENT